MNGNENPNIRNNRTNIEIWLPFTNMNDYLKAIVVIDKLYCRTKKNYKQVKSCIDILVTIIPENDLINLSSESLPIHGSFQLSLCQT